MLLHALHIESIVFIEVAGVLQVGQSGMHGQVYKQPANALYPAACQAACMNPLRGPLTTAHA